MKVISVESEYEKNKELRKEDVAVLKEWAEKEPHLPPISELHLIFFLHSCYYSIEMAKTTIDSYFTYRAHCPELFQNRDLSELKKHFEICHFLHLPQKTPNGDQILMFKFKDLDPNKFSFNDQMKIFDMCIVQWMMQHGTAEGFVIVCDYEGVTLSHILKLNVMTIKKILFYLQDALFVRLKSIHFCNVGAYMDVLMNLVKPFLKKELVNSLHFHTESIKSLYKFVPLDCLPSDYGGLQPSVAALHDTIWEMLLEYTDYFAKENLYIADESKRVGKATNLSDIFGVEGSFKKLDID